MVNELVTRVVLVVSMDLAETSVYNLFRSILISRFDLTPILFN